MQILLNNVITFFSKNIFPKTVQILFVFQDEKTPRITFCFGQSRSQQKFIMNMKSYSTNVQKWIFSSKSRMIYRWYLHLWWPCCNTCQSRWKFELFFSWMKPFHCQVLWYVMTCISTINFHKRLDDDIAQNSFIWNYVLIWCCLWAVGKVCGAVLLL